MAWDLDYIRGMTSPIRPALAADEWRERRSGPLRIDAVGDETHLILQDPDGDVVSVSDSNGLFALMALANCALPNEDARKLTVTDVAVLELLIRSAADTDVAGGRLHALAIALREKLSALLPDA